MQKILLPETAQRIQVTNLYDFECYRNGRLLWREHIKNLVTNEGLNDWLSKYLKGSAYTAAWYVGLIDAAGFSAIAAGDTAAQINGSNGWAELSEYDEANRQALTLGTVSGQSVDNSASKASFTISATKTIKGAFVISNNTIDGTSGVLLGAAAFASDRNMVDNDVLNVTVTSSAASA